MSDQPIKRGRGASRLDEADEDQSFGQSRLGRRPATYRRSTRDASYASSLTADRGIALDSTTTTEPGRSGNARPRRRGQTTARKERTRSPTPLAPPQTPPRVGPSPLPKVSATTMALFERCFPFLTGEGTKPHPVPERQPAPGYISSSPLPSPIKDVATPATLLASASAQIISDTTSVGGSIISAGTSGAGSVVSAAAAAPATLPASTSAQTISDITSVGGYGSGSASASPKRPWPLVDCSKSDNE